MATADCLVDYNMGGAIDTMQKTKPKGGKKSNAGMAIVPKSGENV